MSRVKEDFNIVYKIENNNLLKVVILIILEERCEGICFYGIECRSILSEDVEYYISLCNFIIMVIKNVIYYINFKK